MSRKLTYLAVCIFLVLSLSNGAESATMVAHWRFDDNATDSAGGIDGTLMNGADFTTDAIVGSHALVLDSSRSQYVDFGNPPNLPSGRAARSLCGWARADSVAGGWRWIAAYGSEGTGMAMFIGMNGTSLFGGGYGDDIEVGGFWDVDVWHHICLTYDGSVARLYTDGTEAASATKNWNLVLNRAHVGRQVNNFVEFWDGMVDDVRIYDYALSPAEVKKLATLPKATKPSPADGATRLETWASLSWSPGGYAASHDVYFGESFNDVNDGTDETFRGSLGVNSVYFVVGFSGYPYPDGLVPGTTYYWRIDEVNDTDPNSPWKGDVWSFTVPSKIAYNPNPFDDARFIDTDTTLRWTEGFGAKLHTVYFGDNYDDVTSSSDGIPAGTCSYNPGTLEYDKTYYWRVDEDDGSVIHKGDTWSFKTRPDILISDPNLICWWKLDEGQGLTALDWSGHGNNGTLLNGPKWVSGYDEGALEMDGSDDCVDFGGASGLPYGRSERSISGWGKTNSIADGFRWIVSYGSSAVAGQAFFLGINANDLVAGGMYDDVWKYDFWEVDVWHHICLTYDGSTAILYADGIEVASDAKEWDLALSSAYIGRQVSYMEFWNGMVDDVRIYDKVLSPDEVIKVMAGDPLLAWNPIPAKGSTPDIHDTLPLNWSPGEQAVQHDVYFGTDADAVADADTSTAGVYRKRQNDTTYSPPKGVEWGGGPYYWRVDEYNNDGSISKGKVWDFTVADYLSIDDFENYDAADNQIWYAWHDGLGFGTPGAEQYFAGNGTGSVVGDETSGSYTEENIVNSGNQAMPFLYDNNKQGYAMYSEVEMTLTAQGDFTSRDWTQEGVKELSLWFRGYAASVGSFVEGPAGTYTVTATGADIWGIADQFHFAYKMLSGPGSIVAKVESVDNTSVWAKAGVMIRETLDPDSAHAFVCITPSSGVAAQGRYVTGGDSFNTNQLGIAAPRWVKLERDMSSNFTVSHSVDGSTWQTVQGSTPQSIPMSANVYIGLALTAQNAALTCQAVFSSVTIDGTVGAQWANQDIGIMSNDAEPLYVALSNAAGAPAIVYHDDPDSATNDTWTEWIIRLKDFTDQGINLLDVDRIAIGLGTQGNMTAPGGSGKMFIDEIRLYRSRDAAAE